MDKNKKKRRMMPTVLPLYLWTILFVVLPLAYVVGISFLKAGEVYGVTREITLENYRKMADPMYLKVFIQAFYVAFLTTLITLLVGYPFAYFTARLKKKWRSKILLLLVAPFWLNSLIRLNGWVILLKSNGVLNSLLLSLGLTQEPMTLLYNFGAVLVGMTYALAPFMILAIYNSVEKMDWSLVEAARDLGAGPWRAFITVTLPETLPGVVAGCVLVFVPSVGLFYISDLLGGAKMMLLGNLIQNEMLTARNWPFGAALAIVMLAMTMAAIQIYKKVAKTRRIGGML